MADPAKGSSAKLALKLETTYGTAPGGNYVLFPAISFTLGPQEDFLAADLLGQGRDAQLQDKDVPDRSGTISVPIDRDYLGFWLTMLLGAPTGAGSPTVTHTWVSGSDSLPSATVESQHLDCDPDVFILHTGIQVDSARFTMGGRGRVQLDLGVSSSNMVPSGTSGAGTPAALAGSFTRFSPKHGKVEIDPGGGFVLIGKNTETTFGWENNSEDQYYVGGGGTVGDVIPGVPALSGSSTVLLANTTYLDYASAGTRFPMRLTYSIDASTELVLAIAEAEFASAQPQIQGAGGVALPLNWVGGKTGASPALTVTLKNTQADGTYTPA